MISSARSLSLSLLALTLVLVLTALLYAPGLHGTFVLDDAANLQNLENVEDATRPSELLLYASSGTSGPLGRPLSYLSFALQHESWPADPVAFKLVNILLHLLNGVLVFLLVRRLIETFSDHHHTNWLALAVAAVWLLHPMHVSSVLYVVQRMNLLAGLFVFAGSLAYLEARRLCELKPRVAQVLVWLALPLLALLGLLSKESAAGLLFLVAMLEFVFPAANPPRWWRWWRRIAIGLPLLLVLIAIVALWDDFILQGYAKRAFSLQERLLTESRVLFSYARTLLLPASSAVGLFQDDYPLSKGIWQPFTTAIAITALLLIVGAAWKLRRRLPLVTLGIGWFLAGHLIESSFIALEIYFEHRNYVPAVGLLLAAVALLGHAAKFVQAISMRITFFSVLALIGLYTMYATVAETVLWGDPFRQAYVWAAESPHSLRAQMWRLTLLQHVGKEKEALELLEQLAEQKDLQRPVLLAQVELSCDSKIIPAPDIARLRLLVRESGYSIEPTNVIDSVLHQKEFEKCASVSPDYIAQLLAELWNNEHFNSDSSRGLLLSLMSRTAAVAGNISEAIQLMRASVATKPDTQRALQLALWLAQTGQPEMARHYADVAQAAMRIPLVEKVAYSDRFHYLNQTIESELQNGR